ncbi:putative pyruvate, phosphate dikinase regulatory protein [Alicyclobacillus cellulosilyticus]|uniref:Putative pyruvate, phosphate dikinase regulatory protein n=1 Tax=Alicyclobacillus cellulosilyticus TaxID=1003997 RepID=A0A917NLB4_9BACL|nr:pyruvate, water dikinase regulatory protein [Alicyclobacillus cellulosilyticus]GGJ09233.1 putative pyruvate, phosphate dikinase regulatory protein [Alicyclobacillus cellulosilyticus]
MPRLPVVYIVSDSVGETAEFVVRAAASQFDGGLCDIRRTSHVQSRRQIDEVLAAARAEAGVVAFTLVLPELREHMLSAARRFAVRAVDIMGPMLEAFAAVTGVPPRHQPGLVRQLDEEYFRRVEAIEFAVQHDDGRDPRGLMRADVVLIGVSRTSKTPLSMYLAHRRLRVANLPLLPEVAPPAELFALKGSGKVIGLTIQPAALNLIRRERLRSLGLPAEAEYASCARIREELAFAAEVMQRLHCPVIDVTNKAVEETAALILDLISRSRRTNGMADTAL